MRVMGLRFSGFFSKILEVAGAGLASAVGAFLLSQIVSKPAPTAPELQMVQIAPASADLIGIVRSDQAALLAELQKVAEPETAAAAKSAVAPKPDSLPKAAPAAPTKPAKTAQPVPLPREPKADAARAVTASYKAAAEEPLSIQPVSAAAVAPLRPASPAVMADADPRPAPGEGSDGGRFRVFSTLKQIPSWFMPDTDKLFSDAPRPPMPVGQLLSSAM